MRGGGSSKGLLSIFESNEIVFVLAFALVSQTAIGFIGAFLGRYSVALDAGQELVGLLSAVSALSEVPILLVSSKLIRRFGVVPLLIFSCFMSALRLLLVGTGVIPIMLLGQLLQSVSYMTVYFSCVTYIARNTKPGCQARGQSVFAMVQSGFSVVIANLLGGFICDALGIQAGFYIFSLITLAAAIGGCLAYLACRKRASATC